MSPRPADVRIDDLLDPVFPDGVGEALEAMEAEAEQIDWSPDAAMRAAVRATGLEDFGDDLFVEPLHLLTGIGATSTTLRGSGRVSLWRSLVHNLGQRLSIIDYLSRHPEVHEVDIHRPIIIAGQARTGTTHLHNLMAADPALRSLPYWEAVEPVPPRAEQDGPPSSGERVDPRVARTEASLAGLNHALPHFKRMHDMYAAHVHEEIQLMMPAMGSMLWETTLCDPRYREWYEAADQTPWYRWMRTVLQVCTHLGGGERWVLKSPQHVEQFGPLLETFPDAILLCTHRDPVAISKSLPTMITYSARTHTRPECLIDVGRYWVERVEDMFRAGAAGRASLPESQAMDVRFHEFMADDVAMVERIYQFADQPFTPEVRAAMEAFMADHPRGKHGRVIYDLGDFGHSTSERRDALAFYVEQFGLVVED